ncbi:putative sec23/Sec24, trunk domain, von Willebrand factor A-like domain superfamily [Helianthus annuus]|nr:putative sec23/Sec24, trunk domain, von Willebrand factor A-like domain superfamily [Helianthus annuus]
MFIVPDVQDVYTPLQTDVIVQLSECHQHPDLLLESIPTMFENNKTVITIFLSTLSNMPFASFITQAAFLAMKSTGGKLLVFQSAKPMHNIGIGAFSAREAEGRTYICAGEKELHKLLQPVDETLKTMAIEFAKYPGLSRCISYYSKLC